MTSPVDTEAPSTGTIAQAHVREPGGSDGDEGSGSGETGPLGLILLVAAFVALGFLSIPALIVVLGLVFMIFMHELGHYLTAKRAGMKVTEFFIGFGPRIWSFTRGETEYGVKAIWAGAYVKIIGMNNLEEVDPADEARTYRQKSYPARMSVAVAGSAMHFAMALVLLFVLFAFIGQTVNRSDDAGFIGPLGDAEEFAEGLALAQAENPDIAIDDEWAALLDQGLMPAEAAGLQEGDLILSVDGEPLG
ncbi:MAG: site-2 protease family protein, partial [Actinomycetota bacterium]